MFLTLEDPRAKVQGSRDPLGTLPAWYWFGRRLVGNLTTVSNSTRGFTTVLLARYYTEQLIEEGRAREEDALAIFLRFEQVAAYARYVGHEVEGEIRVIERVKRMLAEEGPRVPIGVTSGAILSDQKTYGLWGLFSVPARASGLIADGPVGLTQMLAEEGPRVPGCTRSQSAGIGCSTSTRPNRRSSSALFFGRSRPPTLSRPKSGTRH